jgi:hypothetical protein
MLTTGLAAKRDRGHCCLVRFIFDTWLLAGLLILTVLVGGRAWLHDHPRYDPWAPLSFEDTPDGWGARSKIATLRADTSTCRDFLRRSGIAFTVLAPAGQGTCRRDDRQVLSDDRSLGLVLRPAGAQATCAVDAAMVRWLRHGVQPAARAILGSPVASLEHYGTNNCRRIGGGERGTWSEHATGNAIDIAAFRLKDGRRVIVRRDWPASDKTAAFLHAVRDAACGEFATVLSPDYNAAHADHLHLDQAVRGGMGSSYCR